MSNPDVLVIVSIHHQTTVQPNSIIFSDSNASIMSDDGFEEDDLSYFTPAVAIIYVPKVASALSLLGSYCIIREVIGDIGRGRSTVISRVLLSMSIADILFSLGWFMTTWPAPKSLPYLRETNYGNVATCEVQGFMLEVGGAASAYFYAFLALCYLLVVRYNYREQVLIVIERRGTVLCWSLAVIGATIPIPLGMYNFSWYVCWVQAHPLGCLESWQVGADEATCTRGDNAFLYSIIVQVIPRWLCFLSCVVIMFMIFCSTRRLEIRNAAYGRGSLVFDRDGGTSVSSREGRLSSFFSMITPRQEPPVRVNRKRSRAVALQGILYCCAIFVAFSSDLISYMLSTAVGFWNETFDIVAYFFTPLAGFLNFLIFIRTRNMQTVEGKVLRMILCLPCQTWLFRTLQEYATACCCDFFTPSSTEASSSARLSSSGSSKADRVIATSEWILERVDRNVENNPPASDTTSGDKDDPESTESPRQSTVEESNDHDKVEDSGD